ncbi:MAG: glycosyltransferase [Desulfuromonadales bacterium]|nr:glycosyltransferase [Desulfuromonadales bacterium]
MEKFSIIIPVKPGGAVAALEALKNVGFTQSDYEVVVAEGTRPSKQRNMAASYATGDILYFIDDDSLLVSDALERAEKHFQDERVAVVGGPSLTPPLPDSSPFQLAIAAAFRSLVGGGGVRNRYRRYGKVRETGDNELILCNLAFRKDLYIALGGLDERLYPNEENELMDRLLKEGYKLIHDPDIYVSRGQRPHWKAFVKQMLSYGRGRAEQTLISHSVSLLSLVPMFFILYLLFLTILPIWFALPLLFYFLIIGVTSLSVWYSSGFSVAWRFCLICPCMHVMYGAGMFLGFFAPRYKRKERNIADVVNIKQIKKFGESI